MGCSSPPNYDGRDVDPSLWAFKAQQKIHARKAVSKNAMQPKKWQVLPTSSHSFFGWSVLKIDQLFPKLSAWSRAILRFPCQNFSLLDALIAIFQENAETSQPLHISDVLGVDSSQQYKNNQTY